MKAWDVTLYPLSFVNLDLINNYSYVGYLANVQFGDITFDGQLNKEELFPYIWWLKKPVWTKLERKREMCFTLKVEIPKYSFKKHLIQNQQQEACIPQYILY